VSNGRERTKKLREKASTLTKNERIKTAKQSQGAEKRGPTRTRSLKREKVTAAEPSAREKGRLRRWGGEKKNGVTDARTRL